MSSKTHYKIEPQLSANQFAEYLTATPVRRRGIIRAAKYQDSPAPIRYSLARRAISRYLSNSHKDLSIILKQKAFFEQELEAHMTGSKILKDFHYSDYNLSLEALDAFLGSFNTIPIPGHTFILGEHSPQKLLIGEVAISVRPDIVVVGTGKDSKPVVGGVLLSFGKDAANKEPQRKEFSSTAATLVHMYAHQELADKGVADRKLCLSLDVFGQSIHSCPNSYKTKKANMEAVAEEIRLLWPTI